MIYYEGCMIYYKGSMKNFTSTQWNVCATREFGSLEEDGTTVTRMSMHWTNNFEYVN